METILKKYIDAECEKLIKRHHDYHNSVHNEYQRKKKILGHGIPDKYIVKPDQWGADRLFNPFYVASNSAAIARSISKKIHEGRYSPRSPIAVNRVKDNGGVRQISLFQIPDVAVSKYFYDRLVFKNKHRFSSFSYAYRNDRNLHYAIQDVAVDFSRYSRVFVAEFDFSKFFDSIGHDYIISQCSENGFSVSDAELSVIKAFTSVMPSGRGIPQGTSISLFLANLVCWRLDKDLEFEGVRFARYADDTLIWSADYSRICNASEAILRFSKESGIDVNFSKSEGIHLIVKDGLAAEMRFKKSVDFLGYSISLGKISIKEKSIKRIKKEISYILYKTLVWPVKSHASPVTRAVLSSEAASNSAASYDLAYLSAVAQIRRYLYGGLSNADLFNYLNGVSRKINFKGLMSFYPLVNDYDQLCELDGWLSSAVFRAMRKRRALLISMGRGMGRMFPYSYTKSEFLRESIARNKFGKFAYQVPSFTLIGSVLAKGLKDLGIFSVMNPKANIYNYFD